MNIHSKQIWKIKTIYLIAAVIVIAFAMIIGISQRKHPELEDDPYQFSFYAENYVYEGGKLTDQQIENLEDSMVDIVQQVICAVNESKTEIDLSAYANNEQWIKIKRTSKILSKNVQQVRIQMLHMQRRSLRIW